MGVKSVTWQVKVTPDLDEKLAILCEKMALSKPELIRVIVSMYSSNVLSDLKFERV